MSKETHEEIEILSKESIEKLMNESSLLKRQNRVVDIFRIIDGLKITELENISLVEQSKKLPVDSIEKQIVEQKIEDVSLIYKSFKPSKSSVGGLIGAGIGGIIGYLIAGTTNGENKIAGTGLGAALGGVIGSFIGSLFDTGV